MSLIFSSAKNNTKLAKLVKKTSKKIYTFSMLAGGKACPFAKECNSKVVIKNGKRKIKDGPHTKFRCFASSLQALYSNVYEVHKKNTDQIFKVRSSKNKLINLINRSLPNANIIRIHTVGGDFFSQLYLDAWLEVCRQHPHIIFYAYTKSLPFIVSRLIELPPNFIYTASYGGYKDELIEKHRLRYAKVVGSVEQAARLKLPIDYDDSLASDIQKRNQNFALLVHGVQPKGFVKHGDL